MREDLRMLVPMIGASTGDEVSTRAFNARYSALRDAALSEHGLDAFFAPRWHAATHEAGHCVIYTIDGFGVVSCRVRSWWHNDKQTWGGRSTPRRKIPDNDAASTVADDQLALRQHMAGFIAEVCFLPDVRAGSSRDEVAIGQLLCENICARNYGRGD
jgi:hypothetical protein